MKNINWKNVNEAGGQPTKDGYICRIIAIDDDEEKEYLKIYLDIALGQHSGYYEDLYERFGFYGLTYIRSYKEKARGLFMKFLKRLEESNQGFVADLFDNDPQKLIGLQIGAILQLRRYTKQNGLDGTQLRVADICNTSDILNGNFTIPDDIDDRGKTETATVTPQPNFGFVNVEKNDEAGLPFH